MVTLCGHGRSISVYAFTRIWFCNSFMAFYPWDLAAAFPGLVGWTVEILPAPTATCLQPEIIAVIPNAAYTIEILGNDQAHCEM